MSEGQGRVGSTARVQIDTDRVRVTEYSFEPGGRTGWHVHEYDYVVVPQTDGLLRIEDKEGVREAALRAGEPYARPAGVEHEVINAGRKPLVFIEVEIKAHGLKR